MKTKKVPNELAHRSRRGDPRGPGLRDLSLGRTGPRGEAEAQGTGSGLEPAPGDTTGEAVMAEGVRWRKLAWSLARELAAVRRELVRVRRALDRALELAS